MSDGTYQKILIDEDNLSDVGNHCRRMGATLQTMIDDYLKIMRCVRDSAVKEGEPSEAIKEFVTYGEQLQNVIAETGDLVDNSMEDYAGAIRDEDKFSLESPFPFFNN